jgi:hypothetical protein
MTIKTLIAISALACSLTALAQDRIVSKAYEIALSNFQAPATANGGVGFKECASCPQYLKRVTPDTRYMLDGSAVRLEDFRKAVAAVSNRDNAMVVVLHHLESDTVKSLKLSQ